jgi:hypothetical protein
MVDGTIHILRDPRKRQKGREQGGAGIPFITTLLEELTGVPWKH